MNSFTLSAAIAVARLGLTQSLAPDWPKVRAVILGCDPLYQ